MLLLNAVHGTSLSLIVRFGVLGILIPAPPGTTVDWGFVVGNISQNGILVDVCSMIVVVIIVNIVILIVIIYRKQMVMKIIV